MTGEDFNVLENKLRVFGKKELALEEALRTLRKKSRQEGLAGNFDASDKAWALFERARDDLVQLQKQILEVDKRLYGSRRRQ